MNGQPAGKSRIEKVLANCVILENWTGVNGYEGKAFHFYDPKGDRWRQVWLDNRGGLLGVLGEYEDGRVRYQGEQSDPQGKPFLQRSTISRLDADRVRQVGEQSRDGGASWTTQFELVYVRLRR